MKPERMQRAYELFAKAAGRPAHERDRFLSEASADDAELRSEVESLLDHDARAGDVFMRTAEQSTPSPLQVEDSQGRGQGRGEAIAPSPFEGEGRGEGCSPAPTATLEHTEPLPATGYQPQIEGYQIVRELSRGGQGVVFQALQKGTHRKVAIKLLLEGPYASKSAQRRFEREIELVAQLSAGVRKYDDV